MLLISFFILSFFNIFFFSNKFSIWNTLEELLEQEKLSRYTIQTSPSSLSLSRSPSLTSPDPIISQEQLKKSRNEVLTRKMYSVSNLIVYSSSINFQSNNLLQPTIHSKNQNNKIQNINEEKSVVIDNSNDNDNDCDIDIDIEVNNDKNIMTFNQQSNQLTESEISEIQFKMKQLANEYYLLQKRLKNCTNSEINSNQEIINENEVSQNDSFVSNTFNM